MDDTLLQPCYCLVGELLLHPEERDRSRVEVLRSTLGEAPGEVRDPLARFVENERGWSSDEYVQTLELSPPCPLYLGTYLFDEPSSCREAGTSTRNGYMIELRGIYEHFGLEPSSAEMPDYLPLMVDFAWISLSRGDRDAIGLRRFFVERYLQPGLPPLHERLERYESPYAALVGALRHVVDADATRPTEKEPRWQPPATVTAEGNKRGLRVIAGANEVE